MSKSIIRLLLFCIFLFSNKTYAQQQQNPLASAIQQAKDENTRFHSATLFEYSKHVSEHTEYRESLLDGAILE